MPGELLLKALSLEKDVISKSESGISWTSDRVTYPAELKGQLLPDDVYHKSGTVLRIYKEGGWGGLFHGDDILFTVHGEFRPYEVLVEDESGDPSSWVTPVLADVYVTYDSAASGGKATLSKVDIHVTALDTVRPPSENPRIRFVCQGSYEPAPSGHIRFEFVIEVDQQAGVSLVENRSSVDAVVTDNSPNGVQLTVAD
ncbi:hypothetical protein [Mesorhizobium sp.]|uniref:hypothetical protein n=1 Tax=Mesorhizobium sp. TaxID=1871066 RepID=UPI000FE7ACDC|nr:hypothetical protein [Mesorhizobium sp.]RWO22127.1 MAG: hypothetical protein EOS09_21015 [Mesorhizobium sp.]